MPCGFSPLSPAVVVEEQQPTVGSVPNLEATCEWQNSLIFFFFKRMPIFFPKLDLMAIILYKKIFFPWVDEYMYFCYTRCHLLHLVSKQLFSMRCRSLHPSLWWLFSISQWRMYLSLNLKFSKLVYTLKIYMIWIFKQSSCSVEFMYMFLVLHWDQAQ